MAQKTAWNGAALTESDINLYLMGEGGAWTSWTPTVTQSGSVTVTNTRSRYARYGRTIHFSLEVTVTGSGTGTNQIVVTLPVTAADAGVASGITGHLLDSSSTTNYAFVGYTTSATTFRLKSTSTDGALGLLGSTTFTAALASGDLIFASGTYEAAS